MTSLGNEPSSSGSATPCCKRWSKHFRRCASASDRIRAAIWPNETETGTRHNVTISRLYKDGDDWKDSTSFGRDDLPLVAKVCDQAHTWIFEQAVERSNGNGHSDNEDHGSEAHY